MRAIGRLLEDLVIVFVAGVLGFFLILAMLAGAALAMMLGGASLVFLVIALGDAIWWLHSHNQHAGISALVYFAYAAGSFALIPVLFALGGKIAAPRAAATAHVARSLDEPFYDSRDVPRLTREKAATKLRPLALATCAVLIAMPAPAGAQPPMVQYGGQGRPIARFEQAPDGGTVQEDWRGIPQTTTQMENGNVVTRDWRGIPIGK